MAAGHTRRPGGKELKLAQLAAALELKGPALKVPTFRTLGALMAPYRIAMRSPLHQS